MESVTVPLGDRSYPIHVGPGLLSQLGSRLTEVVRSRRVCLVSDETVYGYYGPTAEKSLEAAGFVLARHVIAPGDRSKSLAVAEAIYQTLYDAECDRSSCLVALGGGVVGDLTGFVAGTWLRGVPFVQVPTTLEADIDASVGGKTAVNLPRGKNLVGVFHQPRMVLMDIDTLKTLSDRDIRAGLAESIKHGVIRDAAFFELHEQQVDRILALEPAVIEPLLARNCRIKAEVVGADERESGLRAILNFGHTVGHAIEVQGGYDRYRHGEAVALGMVAAGFIAREMNRFAAADFDRMEALIARFNLPTRTRDLDPQQMLDLMKRDKKAQAGKIRFVLPTAIGQFGVFDDVPTGLMAEAVDYIQA